MSREKVAQFRARIKDPQVRKSVDNAISYRRGRDVREEDILAFLQREYGAHLPAETGNFDGSSALKVEPLNSDSESESDTDTESPGILNSEPPPPEREITEAEVAAMIEQMQSIRVSHLHHIGEGVVIEMPPQKKRAEPEPETQKAAEPAPSKDSEPPAADAPMPKRTFALNSVRRLKRVKLRPEKVERVEKTAETDPMRLVPRPSPTKTVFSTLALLTLIGFMSYYLIAATEALYGRGIATLLVLIPLAFVFFVKIPVVRYLALALFLGVDLLSVGALHKIETAGISVSTLDGNPEYQRLKIQYAKGEMERDGINVRTHPTLRDQKAEELKKISGRMTEIESTSRVTEQASAEKSRADVTLGVRALLLVAAAVFAHALLHYTVSIDFDRWVRKAFGRG